MCKLWVAAAFIVVGMTMAQAQEAAGWDRRISVKTNALGWGLAIANVGAEIDICRQLSFSLPVYYSAWNYSSSTVKFRTLSMQPELRYWISEANEGFYIGTHFGCGYYNVATGGEYRTQDHDGKSPALGGGVALGYRLLVSRNNRWKLEFSLGTGFYRLYHDKFINRPCGLIALTEKMTYIGFDQAAVSVVYSFDIKKGCRAQQRRER